MRLKAQREGRFSDCVSYIKIICIAFICVLFQKLKIIGKLLRKKRTLGNQGAALPQTHLLKKRFWHEEWVPSAPESGVGTREAEEGMKEKISEASQNTRCLLVLP